jgi:hypothetical protein
METNTEIQYLQNAADDLGLVVHEKAIDDRRKKVKRYFANKGNETVSPVLDYEQLNHFLAGWRRKSETKRQTPARMVSDCFKAYQEFLSDNNLDDDSKYITVDDLIAFIKDQFTDEDKDQYNVSGYFRD